ncbi:MAG: hypothetical protein KDA79_02270 [Planctomycetaceae bacterium]|nr:hypothetical protein [Planctomycetaceae bacterium]
MNRFGPKSINQLATGNRGELVVGQDVGCGQCSGNIAGSTGRPSVLDGERKVQRGGIRGTKH